jgi:ubiquinone/menaquinone biosynthesis C-methylase UbiE
MARTLNPIVETYSELARKYDDVNNLSSCWGRVTEGALRDIALKEHYKRVVDVGCGTGRALGELASRAKPDVELIGLEPAANMRLRARELTQGYPNVRVVDGCFEKMPLDPGSVDYLYSILAFHWTTDLEQSVNELARVLKPTGECDLIFIGRNNGREFIKSTTPIFLKYMGTALLLESAKMRKQLSRDAALELFGERFACNGAHPSCVIEESQTTYYDTLEGHWSWWVRIEGHFVKIPPNRKEECDREVRKAISKLETDQGIPYTVHLLHVKIRPV